MIGLLIRLLQSLDLGFNLLTLLPNEISELKALSSLLLSYNQLSSLPSSMWTLESLFELELEGNQFTGEWKDIENRDIFSILEFCKKKSSINLFISHTVSDFSFFRVDKISDYLEKQEEIYRTYFCEDNLKGNIDKFIEDTITQCQVLVFLGTLKSVYESKDCAYELFLARKNQLQIIPVSGKGINWKDMANIGLNRELGFEFNNNNFEGFCSDLYQYIREMKREIDLIDKEQGMIDASILSTITLIKEQFKSEYYSTIYKRNLDGIEELKNQFEMRNIGFNEFLKKLMEFFIID